jgi:N-acetylmuramic acid 6-phosphate (MurNAc-6-P) etherase
MMNSSMDEARKVNGDRRLRLAILFIVLVPVFASLFQVIAFPGQEPPKQPEAEQNLLKLLGITVSPESIDYVQNKTQFQLHTLLTEQRHPKTWNLSEVLQKDISAGLRMLLSVDEDIVGRLDALALHKESLEQAAGAIQEALLAGNNIFIYGCGATGRLAKQMESSFWRPFWKRVKGMDNIWAKIKPHLSDGVEEQLIGEMTGADRALISSLEGFEDLQLIGRLQLADRKIKKGDVVICVTEGGETSSVIGAILAAVDQWKAEKDYQPQDSRKYLYFVYNNPDEKLLPFFRSRKVIEEPGITKINLTTGPQAITGSTRMQATTIETFVIGKVLESALKNTLKSILTAKELEKIGFGDEGGIEENLRKFSSILEAVQVNIPSIARFTAIEAQTYAAGHFSTYVAQKGMITVFIDSTERSPTFRLYPLDTVKEPKRKCWIQVWTAASNLQQAWQAFLGRPFRGLSPELYKQPFEEEIDDPYLQEKALDSLKRAGDDQQSLYDFSFSDHNLKNRGPQKEDLGVLVCLSPEEAELQKEDSIFSKFINLSTKTRASVVPVLITDKSPKETEQLLPRVPLTTVRIGIETKRDPLGLDQQIALKILLNAHSTAVMTRLGRVIGNTMTNVSPSNLKLLGRATFLIQSHVNDILSNPRWVKPRGPRKPISYGEANAVLFESIAFLKNKKDLAGQTAEVALSIIRILESLRRKTGLSQEEALQIVLKTGLNQYLSASVFAQ